MKENTVLLKDLKPGDMFKREGGEYRYIVSNYREENCGNIFVYCYNLDGESTGYYQGGSRKVIPLVIFTSMDSSMVLLDPSRSIADKPTKFWMCLVEGEGAPVFKHSLQAHANGEAERLAEKTGRRVFVLEATHYITTYPRVTSSLTELH